MQVIEMVSRASLPTAERTHASTNQSARTRESASPSNDGRRECVPRLSVVLDAFDKIILEYDYDDRNLGPL